MEIRENQHPDFNTFLRLREKTADKRNQAVHLGEEGRQLSRTDCPKGRASGDQHGSMEDENFTDESHKIQLRGGAVEDK